MTVKQKQAYMKECKKKEERFTRTIQEADALGLTYGQYVAMRDFGIQYKTRPRTPRTVSTVSKKHK